MYTYLDSLAIKASTFFLIILIFMTGIIQAFADDNAHWHPLQERDLRVKPNSILDFSYLNPSIKNIIPLHITQRDNDTPHFSGIAKKQRLFCAVMAFQKVFGGMPNHHDAVQYALELHRRGYNMVRFVSLQDVLMAGKKKDFNYDPEKLDRLFYFLAELKKQGIYWEMDVVSWENGAYGAKNRFLRGQSRMLRMRMFVEKSAMQHWQFIVQELFLYKNPYTKQSILTDPSLAMITLVNENDLLQNINIAQRIDHWLTTDIRNKLSQQFLTWLQTERPALYQQVKSNDDVLFKRHGIEHPMNAAVVTFATELTERVHTDMIRFLRKSGYQGLITGMNSDGNQIGSGIPRHLLDVVTMHAYHDLPTELGTKDQHLGPKRRHHMRSSTDQQVEYLRRLIVARQQGKPYVVDEYNHAYPNPWRREASLIVPAYAALHDWDGICRFARPVELGYGHSDAPRNHYITAFGVGMDPIARAGESIAALLFLRRDVSPAPKKIVLSLERNNLLTSGIAWERWPISIGTLGFIAKTSIVWVQSGEKRKKGMIPLNSSFFQLPQYQQRDLLWHSLGDVQALHSHDDMINGFLSEGREIRLQLKNIQIITPHTEAISFTEYTKDQYLHTLGLIKTDSDGLIAVSAMDNKPLEQSHRVLLTYLTDAKSSGLKLNNKTVIDHGDLPVLIRDGHIYIHLKQNKSLTCGARLYALSLQGERKQRIPSVHAVNENNQCIIKIELNTKKLLVPALYFELETK